MTVKRLFIVTGDHSGDIHAARVVNALRRIEPDMHIAAVGGNALKEAGAYLLQDQSQMGRIGIGGLLKGTPSHILLGRKIKDFMKTFNPDAVLLIDYGVFNLWLAKHLKRMGFKILYYIPPQVWASRKGRVAKIRANVDRVFCIFPFEEDLYRNYGIPVTYVGHPLIEELPPPTDRQTFCRENNLNPERKIIGLFPGSRRMEIDYLMEPLLQSLPLIARRYREQSGEEVQFVIAKADSLPQDYFAKKLEAASQGLKDISVEVLEKRNHGLLSVSDMIIAASGTVTLEAALFKTPMVIIYKGGWVAYQLFKKLCYLPCIGLPNILTSMTSPIVPELWQDDVTPEKIAHAAMPFLNVKSAEYTRALHGFDTIHEMLGGRNAAEQVASGIIQEILQTSVGAREEIRR
jgi:lipid-A-disaccharide synthase